MLVSLTMASVAGGGSAGCCGGLLTDAGVGVGVGLGPAAPVRRRGVCAGTNDAVKRRAVSKKINFRFITDIVFLNYPDGNDNLSVFSWRCIHNCHACQIPRTDKMLRR